MSKSRRGDVWILREALERELSPSTTSAVLFEALSTYGSEVPSSPDALRDSARTALGPALEKRVDAELAANLVASVLDALEGSEPEIVISEMRSDPPASSPKSRESTQAVPTHRSPVQVLVIAGGDAFERRLAASLGPRRVAPFSAGNLKNVRRHRTAAIVLVDATDFARIEPVELADELAGLPDTTARVIWGADLPYGRGVLAAMQQIGVAVVSLNRLDGFDPLLDLIRSRRSED